MATCCKSCTPIMSVEDNDDTLARLCEPVYALATGLTQPKLASLVAQSLAKLPALPEWIEPTPACADGLARMERGHAARPSRTGCCGARPDCLRRTARQRAGADAGAGGQSPTPGATAEGRRVAARQAGAAFRTDRRTGALYRGNRGGFAAGGADAAPASGRCRIGQDGGGAERHAGGDGGGQAERPACADRNPRAPAFRDLAQHGAAHRRGGRAADRARQGAARARAS